MSEGAYTGAQPDSGEMWQRPDEFIDNWIGWIPVKDRLEFALQVRRLASQIQSESGERVSISKEHFNKLCQISAAAKYSLDAAFQRGRQAMAEKAAQWLMAMSDKPKWKGGEGGHALVHAAEQIGDALASAEPPQGEAEKGSQQ